MSERSMEAGVATRAVGAAAAGAAFLASSLAAIAEIAAEPTAEPGVLSSTWTPSRGIASLVGGSSWFGGDWDLVPIVLGLTLMLLGAFVFGLLGLALVGFLLGPDPWLLPAMMVGAAWGLVVQIVVVDLLIGGMLGATLAFDSLPHWAWWLGTGTWGVALGLIYSATATTAHRSGVAP